MIVMPAAALVPRFQSGGIRPLAVTTRERSPVLPDVPTFAEFGFPGFEVVEHIAMLARAGTPRPIVARLDAACAAALDAPEVRERMAALTVAPGVLPVEEWPSYVAAETAKWCGLIRARNIRLR